MPTAPIDGTGSNRRMDPPTGVHGVDRPSTMEHEEIGSGTAKAGTARHHLPPPTNHEQHKAKDTVLGRTARLHLALTLQQRTAAEIVVPTVLFVSCTFLGRK